MQKAFYALPPSDEGGGFLRSKKTEGEKGKILPLSRLSPTAPLTRGASKDSQPVYGLPVTVAWLAV